MGRSRDTATEMTLSIRLPEGFKPQLEAAALAQGVTLSEYCRAILFSVLGTPDQAIFQQARALAVYMFGIAIQRIPTNIEQAQAEGWFPPPENMHLQG